MTKAWKAWPVTSTTFWEPRMRRHLFEVLDTGGAGLKPLVLEAAGAIRRPAEAA